MWTDSRCTDPSEAALDFKRIPPPRRRRHVRLSLSAPYSIHPSVGSGKSARMGNFTFGLLFPKGKGENGRSFLAQSSTPHYRPDARQLGIWGATATFVTRDKAARTASRAGGKSGQVAKSEQLGFQGRNGRHWRSEIGGAPESHPSSSLSGQRNGSTRDHETEVQGEARGDETD